MDAQGDPLGLRELGVAGAGRAQVEWGGAGGPPSLSASQLERKVKDIIQQTIQNYRANPENTEAEESWDYVQFQVCGCPGPSRSSPPF